MGGQVPVKIARILETDKVAGVVAGAHVDVVPFAQLDRGLPVHRKDRLVVGIHPDADRGAFRQDNGPVDRQVGGDGYVEPVGVEAIKPSATYVVSKRPST